MNEKREKQKKDFEEIAESFCNYLQDRIIRDYPYVNVYLKYGEIILRNAIIDKLQCDSNVSYSEKEIGILANKKLIEVVIIIKTDEPSYESEPLNYVYVRNFTFSHTRNNINKLRI